MKKKAVIIGAGPAGLTAAYELLKRSDQYEVTVLEGDKSNWRYFSHCEPQWQSYGHGRTPLLFQERRGESLVGRDASAAG